MSNKPGSPSRGGGRDGAVERLERAAASEGESWASDCARALRREGRPPTGGWPGTMSEARARVATRVASRLGLDPNKSASELRWLAQRVYSAARQAWRAAAEPESNT